MPIRILIADDHAVFRVGLKTLLEKETDMKIVADAGDGFEAARAAIKQDIDVLLLDISMPGLTGPQVAETVLQKKPDLAIVVLTMHEDEHYLQELFRTGVRGFVLKKSSGQDLIQAIRAAHRGEHYVDPSMAGCFISSLAGDAAGRESQERLAQLTRREREVCTLLAYGHTNAEIAEQLGISDRTVETHRSKIMVKLRVKSRAELVRFAIENGLLELP